MSARILFSRHLKLHLGKLFKMPDDLLNKLITDCWHRLDPNAQKLYERFAKDKIYY